FTDGSDCEGCESSGWRSTASSTTWRIFSNQTRERPGFFDRRTERHCSGVLSSSSSWPRSEFMLLFPPEYRAIQRFFKWLPSDYLVTNRWGKLQNPNAKKCSNNQIPNGLLTGEVGEDRGCSRLCFPKRWRLPKEPKRLSRERRERTRGK